MIAWNKSTPEDFEQVKKVVNRAQIIWPETDGGALSMDLTAVHVSGCPLDFKKLLDFDRLNFLHDISGIITNIDRATGKLQNCFLPRCSA